MKNIPFGMPYDFSKMEERILADYLNADSLTPLALKLPRKHPMRFLLLYSAGPRTLADLATKFISDEAVNGAYKDCVRLHRAIKLEAEIPIFENRAEALNRLDYWVNRVSVEDKRCASEAIKMLVKILRRMEDKP